MRPSRPPARRVRLVLQARRLSSRGPGRPGRRARHGHPRAHRPRRRLRRGQVRQGRPRARRAPGPRRRPRGASTGGSRPPARRSAARARAAPIRGGAAVDPRHPRVVVLARAGRRTPTQVGAGWAAVNRLVRAAHRGERGVRCQPRLIAEHAAGGDLLVLLGPASELGRALAARRPDLARAILDTWRDRIGSDRVVIEVVSHHGSPDGRPLERRARRPTSWPCRMLGFAREHGAPAVLTNAVRYATSSGASRPTSSTRPDGSWPSRRGTSIAAPPRPT